MWTFFRDLFVTTELSPRWQSGNWSDGLGWLHILADLAIFSAYFAIPIILVLFVIRRKDVPFPSIFWLFAAFIFSCGLTHLIEATLFWTPYYRLAGLAKFVTAVVSWATLVALIPALPRALALPGQARVNEQLLQEIARREKSEAERQSLEMQVLQSQKLESLGVLAGGIAHDFNNLLTSILGNADLAKLSLPGPSPITEHLDLVVKGAERAAELTHQLLAYSGKGKFVSQPVHLDRVVENMARLLKVTVPRNCKLIHESNADLPAIHGDPSQIQQVLMNLILNAAEAIGENVGLIRLRTVVQNCDATTLADTSLNDGLADGVYVMLEVSDNGCGMDETTKAKIFDPFFTTKFTGRGLGLAAVIGIVRSHHGAIKVCSTPGIGTTFRVYLPAVGPATPAGDLPVVTRTLSNLHPTASRGDVLVVDDEAPVRQVASAILDSLGFRAVTVASGAEALTMIERDPHQFRFVLLDLTMPGLRGDETRQTIARLWPTLPVILSSGYTEFDSRISTTDTPATSFLHKPYTVDLLRVEVDRILVHDNHDINRLHHYTDGRSFSGGR